MGIFTIFATLRKSNIFNLVFRSLQLIDALVVIGMYAVDLNNAAKADKYADAKWVRTTDPETHALTSFPPELVRVLIALKVFAVTVGSLAAVTALIFSLASIFFHYRTVALLFAWDWVLTILFAALSGIFSSMYIGEKVEYESGIQRMKTAVGFDLAGLVLWFVTAAFGTWWFVSERRGERRGRSAKA
ncbi:hypothetical protein AYO20_07355 [Fonsecaea nubica]|uniref:MARVEL domain-containing protein n=1 Tax=Fonsecaea nubica TaxID=856822 RepID=A0A178CVQ1_9EURO|nr:hypothetical protein AYO20_07355 [Fonsecaea nubica]OAL33344.1 hypothetical protein AYO20_07355 [Fonsecaea nubica]